MTPTRQEQGMASSESHSPAQPQADPNSPEGLIHLRHSCAHVMAQAVQELYPGTKIAIGPTTDDGFYYDFDSEHRFTDEDLANIEKRMREIAEGDHEFRGETVDPGESKAYWEKRGEIYKVELIEGLQGQTVTHYSHGTFTDLCRGGHVPTTRVIRHFKLLSVAGAYWRGDEKRKMLQRIYGTAFPTKDQLQAHLKRLEEAKRRDHRKLGPALDLFSIQELAGPGLIFWHPKGSMVRMLMENWLRDEALKRGYQMVYTPHIANTRLWETSGHRGFYKDNMFAEIEVEKADYQLKPMNCPFHILIYQSKLRSYRDLPLRLAELGTVYRYERSGVLHGLLRVRGFTQDDAHIFCTREQIEAEVEGCLDFALTVFKTFGFEEYQIDLSTWDPAKRNDYAGEPNDWEMAQAALESVLKRRGMQVRLVTGEAAFYGPKIDVKLIDAIGRSWQLSTIQFDFNLPKKFGMEYVATDGSRKQPLMVHRALYGSIERFFGILIEHYAGAFPLWLAPLQVRVLTLTEGELEPAKELVAALRSAGLRADLDAGPEKLGAKVREATMEKVPYMAILGPRDVAARTVSLRLRDGRQVQGLRSEELVEKLQQEAVERRLASIFPA